jgi:ElaB/YqjD/DUF883 family membrane-anchored ribosome-binding protein
MARKRLSEHFNTQDIIKAILRVDEEYTRDTVGIANRFKRKTILETCKALYDFALNFPYKEDEQRENDEGPWQWVRNPKRLINGEPSDCKSFSVFIGGVLKNLGIDYIYRFASYDGQALGHVYVVALDENGKGIILDPVYQICETGKKGFLNEKPYKFKRDIKMKGLYIGSVKARLGSTASAQDVATLRAKYYPPIAKMLSYLAMNIRAFLNMQGQTFGLGLIEAVKLDIQANPTKILIYNAFANGYLEGKYTWSQTIQNLANAISYAPPASVGNVWDSIRSAVDSVGDFFKNVGDKAGDVFRSFTDWSGKQISSAAEAAQSAAEYVGNKVQQVGVWAQDGAKDFLKDPHAFLQKEGQQAWSNVKKGLLSGPRIAYLALLQTNFRGWGTNLYNKSFDPALKQKIVDKWESLGGNFSELESAYTTGAHVEVRNVGQGPEGVLKVGNPAAVAAPVVGTAAAAPVITAFAGIMAAVASVAAIVKDNIEKGKMLKENLEDSTKDIEKLLNEAKSKFPNETANADEEYNKFLREQANYAANGDPDAVKGGKALQENNNTMLYLGLLAAGVAGVFYFTNKRKR